MDSRIATCAREAQHPTLWDDLQLYISPGVSGYSGLHVPDLSGRHNHGTISRSSSAPDPAACLTVAQGLNCIDFPNANSDSGYRLAGDLPGISLDYANFTLAGWMNLRVMPFGYYPAMLSIKGSTSYLYAIGCADAPAYYAFSDGVTVANNTSWSSQIPTVNTWQHWAVTAVNGFLTIYLNGVVSNTKTLTSWTMTGPFTWRINSRQTFGTFNAQADDVAFWTRGLTQTEIRLLAYGGRGTIARPRTRRVYRSASPAYRRRGHYHQTIGSGIY